MKPDNNWIIDADQVEDDDDVPLLRRKTGGRRMYRYDWSDRLNRINW